MGKDEWDGGGPIVDEMRVGMAVEDDVGGY